MHLDLVVLGSPSSEVNVRDDLLLHDDLGIAGRTRTAYRKIATISDVAALRAERIAETNLLGYT